MKSAGNSPGLADTVVLIGAGASVAQAQHHRQYGKGGDIDPPLDGTFFERATELEWRDKEITGTIHHLRESIKKSGKYRDPFDTPGCSLEQFFADVYYDVSSAKAGSEFSIYVELLSLYCNVIAATTDPIAFLPNGPLDSLLASEYEGAQQNISIITFNHDLLIENALFRLLGPTEAWDWSKLYAPIPLDEVSHSIGTRFPKGISHSGKGIRLLKLHGSLNWIITVTRDRPQLSDLFPRRLSRLRLFPDRSAHGIRMLQVFRETSERGNPQDYWPFVVPPIYEKGNLVGRGIIKDLWDDAGEVLTRAQKLVIFGYSCSEADRQAIQFLRRAVRAQPALQIIECINTDANVVPELCKSLECKAVRFYTDVATYTDNGMTCRN